MSNSIFADRGAERFAALLDQSVRSGRHASPWSRPRPRCDPEFADLVAVSQRLADLEFTAEPDPVFRSELRAVLVAAAQRRAVGVGASESEETVEIFLNRRRTGRGGQHVAQPAPGSGRYAPVRSGRARLAVVVGLIAGALAVSGISAASGGAKPGDTLYGIKRSTEHAKLALAGSELGRGQLYLDFAKTRMSEALEVSGDPAGLSGVLGDMDSETREGVKLLTTAATARHDPAALDAVDAFVLAQRTALRQLLQVVTGNAHGRVGHSLDLLDRINRRTAALRPWLHCDSTGAVMDDLGPRPVRCEAGVRPPGAATSPSADDEEPATGPNGPAGQPPSGAGGPSGGPATASPTADSDQGNNRRKGRDGAQDSSLGRPLGGLIA